MGSLSFCHVNVLVICISISLPSLSQWRGIPWEPARQGVFLEVSTRWQARHLDLGRQGCAQPTARSAQQFAEGVRDPRTLHGLGVPGGGCGVPADAQPRTEAGRSVSREQAWVRCQGKASTSCALPAMSAAPQRGGGGWCRSVSAGEAGVRVGARAEEEKCSQAALLLRRESNVFVIFSFQ